MKTLTRAPGAALAESRRRGRPTVRARSSTGRSRSWAARRSGRARSTRCRAGEGAAVARGRRRRCSTMLIEQHLMLQAADGHARHRDSAGSRRRRSQRDQEAEQHQRRQLDTALADAGMTRAQYRARARAADQAREVDAARRSRRGSACTRARTRGVRSRELDARAAHGSRSARSPSTSRGGNEAVPARARRVRGRAPGRRSRLRRRSRPRPRVRSRSRGISSSGRSRM